MSKPIKDIIYSAGIFDGEGHIGVNEKRRIQVRVVNSSKELVDYFRGVWGGIIYTRKVKETDRTAYDFILSSKEEVTNFIKLVYPYLIVKKEQVDKVLDLYKDINGEDYF